jgi:branched-chain amino acid transport system substrate-binding protein
MTQRRKRLLLGSVLAAVVGSVAVAAGTAGAGGSQATFKLGFAGPYTGPVAKTGDEFKGAVRLALEKWRSRVGNVKIEPVWVDEASDPEKAARATEEAIVGKGIQAGCLNWHSSDAVAMMDVVAKHKVPWFFGMGATDIVNQKFKSNRRKFGYWAAKGWPIPGDLSVAYVEALEDAIKTRVWKPSHGKTVGLWSEDTDWGHSFTSALSRLFRARGWKVSGPEFFRIDATDHYALLNKFKQAGLSVIIGTSTAPQAIGALIKQAREVGLDSLIVADGLGYVGEFYKLTGPASDYVVDQQPLFGTKAAKAFAATFKKRFGFQPSPSAAGLAYDWANFCLKILQRTLQKYGALTSANIYKVAQSELWTGKLTYSGIIMRQYKFTPKTIPDPVIGKGYYIFPVVQYFGGKPVIVYPPDIRQARLKVRS